MTSWKKYVLVAVIVTATVFAYNRNLHRSIPPDFRDAPRDSAIGALKDVNPADVAGDVKIPDMPKVSRGYVGGNDPSSGAPTKPIEWVTINGGWFTMGTDSGEKGFEDAQPIHEVAIKTFDMSKTAVTVEQYAECVIRGACKEPNVGDYCNWGVAGRQLYPVNCVDWNQAQQYAKFKGARLPSEAEWEYAATSGGKNQKYPWGNDEPTCDKAVMYGNGGPGCGTYGTMPVCSKPAGNTAQGLCDMAGNVWQLVQDKYQPSYKDAPVNGRAFEAEVFPLLRGMRGGSFINDFGRNLRADGRSRTGPGNRNDYVGFRLAR